MRTNAKSVAKLTATTLSNISVVGFGLAIFDQRWWCALVAMGAFAIAIIITWRMDHE